MDMQLVMQIVFENPKTFIGISDAKKCNVIACAFREAKKNEQIQSTIIKNRAEVFSIRIFNYLLKNTQKSNEFSKKFIDSVSIMCNRQNEMFRSYFKEYIFLDYIEIMSHYNRFKKGFGSMFYDDRYTDLFLINNYKKIIDIFEINFRNELEKHKDSYNLLNIGEICELHNSL
jgi:hypothetical protein